MEEINYKGVIIKKVSTCEYFASFNIYGENKSVRTNSLPKMKMWINELQE